MTEHNLIFSFQGEYTPKLSCEIARIIAGCGCGVSSGHTAVMGRELVGMFHLTGKWDAIAKIEDALSRLKAEHQTTVIHHRTDERDSSSDMLPYMIEVFAAEKTDLLHELCHFFAKQELQILQLHINRQEAQHTGSSISTLHFSIGVPTELSIATIRGEFMDCCERLNIDAIMEPMK